jgi:hypothetical protein
MKVSLKSVLEFSAALLGILGLTLAFLPLALAAVVIFGSTLALICYYLPWQHTHWNSLPADRSALQFRRAVIIGHRVVYSFLTASILTAVGTGLLARFGPSWIAERVHDSVHLRDAGQRWIPVAVRTLRTTQSLPQSDTISHTYAAVVHRSGTQLRPLDVAIKEGFAAIPRDVATIASVLLLLAAVVLIALYSMETVGDTRYPGLHATDSNPN